MSDRTASASLRPGPPSPSSPAAGSLKGHPHSSFTTSEQTPQTPTSPPLMSVSAQNYASTFASSQTSPSQATSQPTNLSSPPSSAPMSTQASQQPAVGMTNSFPTPASSVSGHFAGATAPDDPENTESKPPGPGTSASSAAHTDVSMRQIEHRPTNHDRQSGALEAESGIRDFAGVANNDDAMDIDQDTTAPSNYQSSLDSLQREFSSPFHLCKNCKSFPRLMFGFGHAYTATGPDPSLDLVSLYGLGPVAKSVARIDPVTGEKINRLRKSYEGKLKGLGLAGRNKPVKSDPNKGEGLRVMTMWPEEEWQIQKVYGKEIKVADMDSALHHLQMKAMKMEPGVVPNNEHWEDILGHEKPAKHTGASDAGKKPAPIPNGARPAGPPNGTPGAGDADRNRPSRGRKRHYDENSFVGYGEGYADDDDDGAFYSNGEGIGKKKRKKEHASKISTPLPDRGGSYGVGMYGIGAR